MVPPRVSEIKNLADCDITEVRALLEQSIRDGDASDNGVRFTARLERLIELKMQEALQGYQRQPLRFR